MQAIMSNWRQVQARIRRARAAPDAATQLEKLFEKTRDAMVAFELAKHLESAGKSEDAARWYGLAAQRFRRTEWKKKAEEAAVRLSGSVPVAGELLGLADAPEFTSKAERTEQETARDAALPEPAAEETPTMEAPAPSEAGPRATGLAAEDDAQRKRRRRGRRGGRGRGRRRGQEGQATPSGGAVPAQAETRHEGRTATPVPPSRVPEQAISEAAEAAGPGLRGRSGDPGLASRLAQLEMQMRRLLACKPVKLDEAERGPAGPGVFLVTDSDMITHYYVEACKTLRIGMANLLRAGAGRREEPPLKARFADHLGISEARVGKYVSEHCVMRWLQLDENASGFAHFAIAVLKPVLND